jgi:hypothetical protein
MTKSSKKTDSVKQSNHNADINNSNKGTDRTNITYDQNQGNRGKQLNPNQKPNKEIEVKKHQSKNIHENS